MSQIRFANSEDGWAFDPALWSTEDGGATWARVNLPGVAANAIVQSLETADGLVSAAAEGASDTVTLETSRVGSGVWKADLAQLPLGAGPIPAPQLVLQGATGWFVEVDRVVISGARLEGGQWQPWQPPCLGSGGAADLAASTPLDLIAVCDQGLWATATPAGPQTYVSADGGASFEGAGPAAPSGVGEEADPIASPAPGVAVVAGGSGLLATFDGGATWTTVYTAPADTGVAYVGFETSTQGVAIASDDAGATTVGALLITFDGGHSWSPVAL
ncbi:MAG: WD40/YVTN/BNR-like repeat-containing protein [Candidatus Dormibacteria bacterium]